MKALDRGRGGGGRTEGARHTRTRKRRRQPRHSGDAQEQRQRRAAREQGASRVRGALARAFAQRIRATAHHFREPLAEAAERVANDMVRLGAPALTASITATLAQAARLSRYSPLPQILAALAERSPAHSQEVAA